MSENYSKLSLSGCSLALYESRCECGYICSHFLIFLPTAMNEKKKASLVAKCCKTGKIVGTRFGEIVTRESVKTEPKIYFLGNHGLDVLLCTLLNLRLTKYYYKH